jgi:putative endonuclease
MQCNPRQRPRPKEAERPADPRRRLGAKGERLASEHLEARGFEIVERNFRTRHGELDLVVADDRFLVFCEVKTRVVRVPDGPLGPFAAIGPRKRAQVRSMAREWLAQRGPDGPRRPELRFDAVGISFDPTGRLMALEHLEGAF